MLTLKTPKVSLWDEQNEKFLYIPEQTLEMEHSLVSISKWESNWEIPFLSKESKTADQLVDYLRCMTLSKKVDPRVFYYITTNKELLKKVTDYIEKPMTATRFKEKPGQARANRTLTSEYIYYLMIAFNIPQEYQKWHINRLLTLIQLCDRKNTPKKKTSKHDILKNRYYENEARKKLWKTKG